MGAEHSYTITLSNNNTEKQAIDYLLSADKRFLHPTKDGRKAVIQKLGLPASFSRTYDLIMVDGVKRADGELILTDEDPVTLIEVKSTRKKLLNNPHGFFFGATENEFKLAKQLGDRFKFCFVCLHPEAPSYQLLTLAELQPIIATQRIQFQINLR